MQSKPFISGKSLNTVKPFKILRKPSNPEKARRALSCVNIKGLTKDFRFFRKKRWGGNPNLHILALQVFEELKQRCLSELTSYVGTFYNFSFYVRDEQNRRKHARISQFVGAGTPVPTVIFNFAKMNVFVRSRLTKINDLSGNV